MFFYRVLLPCSQVGTPAPRAVVEGEKARSGPAGARAQGEDIVLTGRSEGPWGLSSALALIAALHPEDAFRGRILAEDGTEIIAAAPGQ